MCVDIAALPLLQLYAEHEDGDLRPLFQGATTHLGYTYAHLVQVGAILLLIIVWNTLAHGGYSRVT